MVRAKFRQLIRHVIAWDTGMTRDVFEGDVEARESGEGLRDSSSDAHYLSGTRGVGGRGEELERDVAVGEDADVAEYAHGEAGTGVQDRHRSEKSGELGVRCVGGGARGVRDVEVEEMGP